MHVGVKGSEGHSVDVAVSSDEVVDRLVICEVGCCCCCWENNWNVVDERSSKMKRKRNTKDIRASLRVHVTCVLDLMVY